jgi:2-oxo-4-hydroxy-4-carboxy-5-ureidoimidazoline decarboxylase
MFRLAALNEGLDQRQLMTCLRSRAWATRMLAARPYASMAQVEEQAMAAARALTDDQLTEALAAHPRIGDRPMGPGAEAGFSRTEQSGVADDAGTATAALRQANEEYEARFGHVFLIRAAGRDGEQILAAARERLGNDPVTEGRVVREQLGEIAVLRLRSLLGESGP